jgi:hypothetical protein
MWSEGLGIVRSYPAWPLQYRDPSPAKEALVSAKTKTLVPFLYATTLALGACVANDPAGDPATAAAPVSDTPATSADDYGYVAVRPDPASRQGGLLAHSVNLTATLCGDGTYAPECRVAALDLKALDPAPETEKYIRTAAAEARLIVRGTLRDDLVVSEAWVAAGEATGAGTFARVTSTGIVCVAAPCPSLHAAELNTKKGTDLADLDFSGTKASPRQVEGARETVREKSGLLVAAKAYQVTGPAGSMPGYLVQQFYLPVSSMALAMPRPPTDCYVGGCSSELCTDDPDALSPCIFKPENECFRSATCERQPDLRCGWTPTDELRECLANPPALE